jgi:hypothetical protein
MTTPTMVYREVSDKSDPSRIVENDAGRWEWMIVDLEEGQGPPSGWQSLPETSEAPASKPQKRKKPDAEEPVAGEVTPNGDGD